MEKISLDKALKEILITIDKLDIKVEDKAELFLNLYNFLDEDKYEENIETLRNKETKKRLN